MSDNPTPPEGGEQEQEQTYTKAQLDELIQAEVSRVVKKKAEDLYRRRVGDVDIDTLKAKAEDATTLEERVAEIEARAIKAETEALRARVAGEYGISTKRGDKGEPSDADLFLTGTDEETLTAQAKRLADRESERKKQGNHVPREGNNPKPGDDEMRVMARSLFGSGE